METSPDLPFNPDDYSELYESIEMLKKGDSSQSVYKIACEAVGTYNLGLIGTVESTPIHEPRAGFMIFDRNFGIWDGQETPQSEIQLTYDPDLAIMCGLFGDMNIRGQRALIGKSLTDKRLPHFGWEETYDDKKRLIARPELIRAARKAGSTIMGAIDLVYTPENEEQYLTYTGKRPGGKGERVIALIRAFYVPLYTVLSIPVRGSDLPRHVHAVNFDEVLIPPPEA